MDSRDRKGLLCASWEQKKVSYIFPFFFHCCNECTSRYAKDKTAILGHIRGLLLCGGTKEDYYYAGAQRVDITTVWGLKGRLFGSTKGFIITVGAPRGQYYCMRY